MGLPLWQKRWRQIVYEVLRVCGTRGIRVQVRGRPLWIDLRDRILGRYFWVFRTYEPFEADLLEAAAGPGMCAVDIGANVGYLTVLLGHRVGAAGRVVSFEPDPSNFELLTRSVKANGLTNVTLERAAVMESDSQATLHLSEVNFGDHRIFSAGDEGPRRSVEVRGLSLDDYLRKAGWKADIIKMDIQGAELSALSGMPQTLRNPDLVLFCEFWPHGLRGSGAEPRRVLDVIAGTGLEIFEIDEEAKSVRAVDVEDLASRYSGEGSTNLVCCRAPRAARLFEGLGIRLSAS